MTIVLLTALGVGGATILGALLGFIFKRITSKTNDLFLSFAAGVMLAASVFGLIIPSVGEGTYFSLLISVSGIFSGALLINFLDKLTPHLHKLTGIDNPSSFDAGRYDKVILFVLAIAIHNIPEGIAAGVSFGTGNTKEALTVAFGIALQNLPEGMVIIAPMLSLGMSKKRTLISAFATGAVEIFGTLLGYFAISISGAILPFALAFAGGTMLYVICNEMIPQTHSHESKNSVSYAFLAGFSLMVCMNYLI